MKNSVLFKPLIYLTILFFVITILSKVLSQNISDYLANISIEILGSIITIIFLDFYLNKQEKLEAEKRERIALKLLRPIIHSNLSILFTIFKATTDTKGKNFESHELSNFFNEKFAETIQKLKVTNDAPIVPTVPWNIYLMREFQQINNKYENILDKYSPTMTPELVGIIENIKNSRFHMNIIEGLQMILNLSKIQNFNISDNIFEQYFSKEYVLNPYLQNINDLLTYINHNKEMNNIFKIDDGNWRNDISPKIGSSRI